jgi:type IV pilus assembly protein PilY1
MMLLGSGQHGYDGRAAMYASLFGVLLVQQGTAPSYVQMPILDKVNAPLTYKSSFMGDLITFDRDLDFRSDAVYGGRTISGAASCGDGVTVSACGTGLGFWTGKAYRLTMGTCTTAPCSVMNWGVIDSGWLLPTEMVTAVPIGGTPVPLGPVTAGSGVTLDSASNTWVFFGTGRFLSTVDKTDQHAQYLVGVKDSVTTGTCTQTSLSTCKDEALVDVTNAAICVSCSSGSQVQGVGTITTFSDLVNKTQTSPQNGGASGWVIQLASNAGSTTLGAERSIVNPTVIGGAVFFPTFTPSSDVCVSTGTSTIYGLYYMTGTGYTDPIFGVDANGKAVRSIDGGQGVASSVAIQIGAEPTGMAGYFQSSNSSITKVSPKVPAVLWSQFMAWVDQRT